MSDKNKTGKLQKSFRKRFVIVVVILIAILIVAGIKTKLPKIAFPSDIPIDELTPMDAKASLIDGEYEYLVVKKGDMDDEYITSYINSLDCIYEKTIAGNQIYKVRNANYNSLMELYESGKIYKEELDKKVEEIMRDTGLKVRDITISLSGKNNPDAKELNQFMVLNDQHSLLTYGESTEENHEVIDTRYSQMFVTPTGVHSEDCWQNISAIIDTFDVDGILMAGDMIDFESEANYHFFKKGLEKIKTPILYARADHDRGLWYQADDSTSNAEDLGLENEDVMYWDMDSYYILAWNNSTSQMTEKGLAKAKEIYAKGKPIILMTHVPLCPTEDMGLVEAAKAFDDKDRVKLWGNNCLYMPNDTTQEFLDLIYEENSLIKAVISGHLHFEYTGKLTENAIQYVLAPTFEGNMTRVKVTD